MFYAFQVAHLVVLIKYKVQKGGVYIDMRNDCRQNRTSSDSRAFSLLLKSAAQLVVARSRVCSPNGNSKSMLAHICKCCVGMLFGRNPREQMLGDIDGDKHHGPSL